MPLLFDVFGGNESIMLLLLFLLFIGSSIVIFLLLKHSSLLFFSAFPTHDVNLLVGFLLLGDDCLPLIQELGDFSFSKFISLVRDVLDVIFSSINEGEDLGRNLLFDF